jgi:uncharacterized membrane protein
MTPEPQRSQRPSPESPLTSTTGLSPRLAAVLAYAGWWVSGAIFWWVERSDAFVRFHAAQSVAAFGLIALVIAAWGAAAVLSLSLMPSAFLSLMWAAGATWGAGVLLWLVAMWKAGRGQSWRMPLAGSLAGRMTRST